ncbi:hypothetical protein CROQUDRAFT_654540, partial [Cronartium quercuum f. sp. fusiforme G11]
ISPEQLRDPRDVPDWYISGIPPVTSLGGSTRGHIPGIDRRGDLPGTYRVFNRSL